MFYFIINKYIRYLIHVCLCLRVWTIDRRAGEWWNVFTFFFFLFSLQALVPRLAVMLSRAHNKQREKNGQRLRTEWCGEPYERVECVLLIWPGKPGKIALSSIPNDIDRIDIWLHSIPRPPKWVFSRKLRHCIDPLPTVLKYPLRKAIFIIVFWQTFSDATQPVVVGLSFVSKCLSFWKLYYLLFFKLVFVTDEYVLTGWLNPAGVHTHRDTERPSLCPLPQVQLKFDSIQLFTHF